MQNAHKASTRMSRESPSSPKRQTADIVKVVVACVGLGCAGYFLLRATGVLATGAPSREQLRELQAEQAELQRLAPPTQAPVEVKLQRGGAPG